MITTDTLTISQAIQSVAPDLVAQMTSVKSYLLLIALGIAVLSLILRKFLPLVFHIFPLLLVYLLMLSYSLCKGVINGEGITWYDPLIRTGLCYLLPVCVWYFLVSLFTKDKKSESDDSETWSAVENWNNHVTWRNSKGEKKSVIPSGSGDKITLQGNTVCREDKESGRYYTSDHKGFTIGQGFINWRKNGKNA
jgi:hypothetical protein